MDDQQQPLRIASIRASYTQYHGALRKQLYRISPRILGVDNQRIRKTKVSLEYDSKHNDP